MEVEQAGGGEGGCGGGGERPSRTRCYSVLLFLLDLALVTLFVPRGVKMSVRLIALLALRALLTTLATATNVGIYQAFLYNAGQTTEETQLAAGVNALFGVTPGNCRRAKRDTWSDLLETLNKEQNLPDQMDALNKDNGSLVVTKDILETDLTYSILPSWTVNLTATMPPTLRTTSFPTGSSIYTTQTSLLNVKEDEVETRMEKETCLGPVHLLTALSLFALTALMNVILLSCLLSKMGKLRAQEHQLRGSFDALQRLYAAGRMMEDVNLE